MLLTWENICCMLKSRKPYNIYIPTPEGEKKTSVTFQTDGNIPISLHVFAFLLIVEQDTVFIHDAAFFLHVCALRKLCTLSYVTWRIFHSDTFPQFIPSPFFVIEYTKLLSGFTIGHIYIYRNSLRGFIYIYIYIYIYTYM